MSFLDEILFSAQQNESCLRTTTDKVELVLRHIHAPLLTSNSFGNVSSEDHFGEVVVDGRGGIDGSEHSKRSLGKCGVSSPLSINLVGIHLPVSVAHQFKFAQKRILSVEFHHHFSSLDVGDIIIHVDIELPGGSLNVHVDFVVLGIPCSPVKGDSDMFAIGKLKDLLELFVSLGVVNNNKLFTIELENSLDSIAGYLEVAHLWSVSDDVKHLSFLVLNSDFEGVSARIIKDHGEDRWSIHLHNIRRHPGVQLILKLTLIIFVDTGINRELVEVHILVLEVNMNLEVSIPLVVTSSKFRSCGAEHGSSWDIKLSLKIGLDDIGVECGINQEKGFRVLDDFNKDLGLSSDGQLHVSEVCFHNKFLSSLVVNSNSPYWQAEHVHWAGHPEWGLGLSPG